MKLQQLQHLVAIVEHGSLRAAARRLGEPQPSLTRSIRALEKDMGCALFVRETTGMTLTSIGRRFHQRACAIVNEARRARDDISQLGDDAMGSVSVALSIMPQVGMLPRALPAFRLRYPKVKLQLVEGLFPDVESELREGSVDFYVGAVPREAPAPGLTMEHLFKNTRVIVCRRGHKLAGSRSLKQLADADWAGTAAGYAAGDEVARTFAQHGLAPPRVLLRARSAMSIMVALASSDLISMLPMQWQEFSLTRDLLQVVRIKEALPGPDITLIRRSDLPLTPAAEFLADIFTRYRPAA